MCPHPVPPPVPALTVAESAPLGGIDDRPLTGDVTAAAGPLPALMEL
ncbi:hypothetical protein [Streptomyces sp. NPDC014995]